MGKCAICGINERAGGMQVCSQCAEGITKLLKVEQSKPVKQYKGLRMMKAMADGEIEISKHKLDEFIIEVRMDLEDSCDFLNQFGYTENNINSCYQDLLEHLKGDI